MIGFPIGQAQLGQTGAPAPVGVGFPDPAADQEKKKRDMLAQLLMQQNSQPNVGAAGAFSNILGGGMAGWQMGQQQRPQAAPAALPPLGGAK